MIIVRIEGGRVAEIIQASDTPLADRFHPDLVAQMSEAPEGVGLGWTLEDGNWAAPGDSQQPPPSRIISPRQFMDRLPRERQLAIFTAGQQAPEIGLWLFRLTSALEVDLDDAETVEGVQSLAAANVITNDEAAALLASSV